MVPNWGREKTIPAQQISHVFLFIYLFFDKAGQFVFV